MIKKDFNLFSAYKSSSAKGGRRSSKGLVFIVIFFILIIAVAYSGIILIKLNKQEQITKIKNELSIPASIEAQSKLTIEAKKNRLMTLYNTTLILAKKNFGNSRIIDSDLLGKIASSTPKDFKISNITINPQNISISGNFTNKLSSAAFKQELDRKDIFSKITYNSIINEDGVYFVVLNCTFKEVATE